MAPFAKSLLNLLRADSNGFTESLQSLRNKALHSNARGWEKLAREFGKGQSDSNTIPVIQLLFEAVVHKSPQMPSTMAASSHTTSRMKTKATRTAVPLLDALDHCCMNLIHLHGTPGWCVSGGSLLLGVLSLVSTHHTRMEDVPLQSLQRLLQHCRELEWTGLDCFLVMKQTQELGYAPLSEQLREELIKTFQWTQSVLAILQMKPIAPLEKLKTARNWFMQRQDGYMAYYLRRFISTAETYDMHVHCKCRARTEENGESHWIGCDACGAWYHPKCVGIDTA